MGLGGAVVVSGLDNAGGTYVGGVSRTTVQGVSVMVELWLTPPIPSSVTRLEVSMSPSVDARTDRPGFVDGHWGDKLIIQFPDHS
jgi:hypothetical protein